MLKTLKLFIAVMAMLFTGTAASFDLFGTEKKSAYQQAIMNVAYQQTTVPAVKNPLITSPYKYIQEEGLIFTDGTEGALVYATYQIDTSDYGSLCVMVIATFQYDFEGNPLYTGNNTGYLDKVDCSKKNVDEKFKSLRRQGLDAMTARGILVVQM